MGAMAVKGGSSVGAEDEEGEGGGWGEGGGGGSVAGTGIGTGTGPGRGVGDDEQADPILRGVKKDELGLQCLHR